MSICFIYYDYTFFLKSRKGKCYNQVLKVSERLVVWGMQTWDQLSILQRQFVAELRGEKLLPSQHLNSITIEVAEVLAKHGYPLKYQEDYNALRMALGENYFGEWQGHDLTHQQRAELFGHTDWTALRKQHHSPTVVNKTFTWLRAKLARNNSSI
jgi:hypothetical protein